MGYIEKVVTAPRRDWFDDVEDAPFDVQASVIRDQIAISTNSSETVMLGTGLNLTTLQGKRVLDLASGLSTFVADCHEHGIQAVGVDTAYANSAELEARGIMHDSRGNYVYKGDTFSLSPQDSAALNTTLAYLNGGGPRNEALDDILANPSRYVAGSVLDLPFQSGVFDMVVCHSLITSEPGLSAEFTEGTIQEALRVLKKQGDLRIGFMNFSKSPEYQKAKEDNIRTTFEKAKREKLAEKFSKISVGRNEWAYSITRSRKR